MSIETKQDFTKLDLVVNYLRNVRDLPLEKEMNQTFCDQFTQIALLHRKFQRHYDALLTATKPPKLNGFVLPDEFVQQITSPEISTKSLTLEIGGNPFATVNLEKYPDALQNNVFYPFRKTVDNLKWNDLKIGFMQIYIFDTDRSHIQYVIQHSLESEDKCQYFLYEGWDGCLNVLQICNGVCISAIAC